MDDLKGLMERTKVTMTCFAPITFFAERGVYSGHPYQPAVNHREMSFRIFTHSRQSGDHKTAAMIDSMVFPTESNSFSVGNVMSMFFYEIEAVDEIVMPLKSPAAIDVKATKKNREERSK